MIPDIELGITEWDIQTIWDSVRFDLQLLTLCKTGCMFQIINGILDLSKLEADQMSVKISSFEIDQMIQKVVDTVKPIIEKHGNTLLVNNQLTFYRLDSDELKIQQILLNLLFLL